MEVKRTQFAIGQGGFHAAEIRAGALSFRYIYDCGAKNRKLVQRTIKSWSNKSKKFDWLIVSSFDADHFNCIDDLLNAGFSFRAIVLPHLLDVTLLKSILLYFVARRMPDAELANVVRIFQRILSGDFGIVIPTTDPTDPSQVPTQPGADLISTEQLAADSHSIVSRKMYSVSQQNWMLQFYSIETNHRTVIADIFSMPLLLPLKELVEEIATSVHGQVGEEKVSELLTKLSTVLKRVHESAVTPEPAPMQNSEDQTANPAGSDQQYLNKTIKQILGMACKSPTAGTDLLDDYNAASLCLYSGPIFPAAHHLQNQPGFHGMRYCADVRRQRKLPAQSSGAVGWLGVGDITFTTSQSVADFQSHYGKQLRLAGTRMLAHHGAQSNYGPTLANLATLGRDMPAHGLWVAAADPLKGGYRHPDGAVIDEAILTGAFHLVSADPGTALHEHVVIPRAL